MDTRLVPPANSMGWAKQLSQDTTQAPQQNRDSSAPLLIRSGCANKALTEPVGSSARSEPHSVVAFAGSGGAREQSVKAIRAADRAEAEAWSIRMEGYGGPAPPSPTIGQCLNGGLGWLKVKCHRCKTEASIPLECVRRPKDTPIRKLEASLKCRSSDHALRLGVHPDDER
jgi:hypothetical protein